LLLAVLAQSFAGGVDYHQHLLLPSDVLDGDRDAAVSLSAHSFPFDFELAGNGLASPIRDIASDLDISRSTGLE